MDGDTDQTLTPAKAAIATKCATGAEAFQIHLEAPSLS